MNLEIFDQIKLNNYFCYIIGIILLWYLCLDCPIPISFDLNNKYKYYFFLFTSIFLLISCIVFTNFIICGILIIVIYEIINKFYIAERKRELCKKSKSIKTILKKPTQSKEPMVSTTKNNLYDSPSKKIYDTTNNIDNQLTLEEVLVDNSKILSTKNILHSPTPRYQAILPDIQGSSIFE